MSDPRGRDAPGTSQDSPPARPPRQSGTLPATTVETGEFVASRQEDRRRASEQRRSRPVARTPQPPSALRVLETMVRLARKVDVHMRDEDLVHLHLEAFEALFPGRWLAIRILNRNADALSVAAANGRLREDRRDRIVISRGAASLHELSCQECNPAPDAVSCSEEYLPLFVDGASGFDVPLLDGSTLLGAVSVEYPPGVEASEGDRLVMGSLAVQLSAALRNARLARETLYLRDYLGKLIDHANVPIVMLGHRREIRVANQALLALIGRERVEVLGRDFMELIDEAERPRLLPVFVRALRGRPTRDLELTLPRKEGGFARLSLNVASILGSEGDVEGVIAIGRDLTELRELEGQVQQAEKLATLGHLAAGVVHELNNPLTGITVYGEQLLRQAEREGRDPSEVEKLRRIVEAAERILRFTRDLVAYARPSTEPPQRLHLPEVLDQAIVFCEHVLRETGVQVHRAYEPDLPPVAGVRDQLSQVFVNLVTNACHAMPEGGTLYVLVDAPSPEEVRVRVRDEGTGIRNEDLQRIFEPFFSTKSRERGTGLGLSIVRNIVEQHGGRIDVDSVLGRGTTFSLFFPSAPRCGPGDPKAPPARAR